MVLLLLGCGPVLTTGDAPEPGVEVGLLWSAGAENALNWDATPDNNLNWE